MSMSIPSFVYCATNSSLQKKHKARSYLTIRAQCSQDEGGKSRNRVDSNMKLLKHRIEVIKTKERLLRPYGWDYGSNHVHKREKQPEYLQTIALFFGISIFSMLFGTTLLCIFAAIARSYLPISL